MAYVMLACACLAPAQALPDTQVKAAFVLNFTKFIEWPTGAFRDDRAPFTICVLGEHALGDALVKTAPGETVDGRAIVIERIHRPAESRTCQVVVVGGTEKGVAKTLAGLGPGVLTVGEGEAFVREGGMIGFIIENRRVRFDINQAAATRSRLTMSARLLSVARTVQR